MQELAITFPESTEKPSEFSHIELTDEELLEAVRLGRQAKNSRLRIEEYNQKIQQSIDWSRPTARELFEALLQTRSQTGERFQVTEWNKKVVNSLCLYFAGDPGFETYNGGKLEKGIMLMGNPGAGKSHLMAFFHKNPHASYANVTCTAIAERYRTGWQRDELDTLQWYSYLLKAEAGHQYDQTELGYCFGDLGTEGEKKNFGNTMNVMENIIFQRYENHLPFNMTHITTNLNPKEVEEIYGIRVRDRLKEMCNVLILEGQSWR